MRACHLSRVSRVSRWSSNAGLFLLLVKLLQSPDSFAQCSLPCNPVDTSQVDTICQNPGGNSGGNAMITDQLTAYCAARASAQNAFKFNCDFCIAAVTGAVVCSIPLNFIMCGGYSTGALAAYEQNLESFTQNVQTDISNYITQAGGAPTPGPSPPSGLQSNLAQVQSDLDSTVGSDTTTRQQDEAVLGVASFTPPGAVIAAALYGAYASTLSKSGDDINGTVIPSLETSILQLAVNPTGGSNSFGAPQGGGSGQGSNTAPSGGDVGSGGSPGAGTGTSSSLSDLYSQFSAATAGGVGKYFPSPSDMEAGLAKAGIDPNSILNNLSNSKGDIPSAVANSVPGISDSARASLKDFMQAAVDGEVPIPPAFSGAMGGGAKASEGEKGFGFDPELIFGKKDGKLAADPRAQAILFGAMKAQGLGMSLDDKDIWHAKFKGSIFDIVTRRIALSKSRINYALTSSAALTSLNPAKPVPSPIRPMGRAAAPPAGGRVPILPRKK